MGLFKPMMTPDRQQTQLAYRVKYWPFKELSDAARELIAYRKFCVMTKRMILDRCSEDLTDLHTNGRPYKILWAYNNQPTQQEWEASADNRQINVELRCSAAIDSFAVAILSFGLPSERLTAHKNGEFA